MWFSRSCSLEEHMRHAATNLFLKWAFSGSKSFFAVRVSSVLVHGNTLNGLFWQASCELQSQILQKSPRYKGLIVSRRKSLVLLWDTILYGQCQQGSLEYKSSIQYIAAAKALMTASDVLLDAFMSIFAWDRWCYGHPYGADVRPVFLQCLTWGHFKPHVMLSKATVLLFHPHQTISVMSALIFQMQ